MLSDGELICEKCRSIDSLIGGGYNLDVVVDALGALLCPQFCAVEGIGLARDVDAKTQVTNTVREVKVTCPVLLHVMD